MEASLARSPTRKNKVRRIQPGTAGAQQSIALEPELRRTGIRVLGTVPWGTHICVFYETKQDLLDTCVAYFKEGLDQNEFCVWAVSKPIAEEAAMKALRAGVPYFDRLLAEGRIELLRGYDWYLKGREFNLKAITSGWNTKLQLALAKGFDGMRVSGNAFWLETKLWKEFCAYEEELDRALVGQKMIVMCTYSLKAARAADLMDVARAHQFSMARRNGEWEFLETPDLKRAKQEIQRLNSAIDILSGPFNGHELMTPRERGVLAQMVKGASNKEIGRELGISTRTVEFHRKNIMEKLGAKNIVDLVHKVLGEQ
jgi:DNA-binding CsgD family transcriptional regulator